MVVPVSWKVCRSMRVSRKRRCSASICCGLTELATSITTSSGTSRRSLAGGAPLGPRRVAALGPRQGVVFDIDAAASPLAGSPSARRPAPATAIAAAVPPPSPPRPTPTFGDPPRLKIFCATAASAPPGHRRSAATQQSVTGRAHGQDLRCGRSSHSVVAMKPTTLSPCSFLTMRASSPLQSGHRHPDFVEPAGHRSARDLQLVGFEELGDVVRRSPAARSG